ncbi:Rpn family recombination-promoting nuclease/putative transposase [Candidatus Tisiphia endosymbiont of Dascillus cervinus]|uniref:Rpn family recombination-promoting nuclease/putative transposase n=1 Tax=Candidatus Tisiphia endosymbiont of Dascillus cervinus TaxID=3066253 RepID=UPI00312C928E
MEKITPRVDLAFKKIFGVEENKDLLISLINSIVGQEDQVAEVTLLNPYNPKNFKNDKLSILDIKAKSVDGKRFNIEIQISDEADYDKRALYYWAKLYTEQLKVAQDYSTLSKAIGIHILNFTSIPNVTKYHNVFHIVEKDSGLLYFKDLELHTIELNKFTDNSYEELPDILKKVKNSLDMWTAFLTRHDLLNKDNLPKELDNASLKKALTVLDVMNFTDEEREAYEDHLKWLRIEANTLKKQLEKGREEGIIAIAKEMLLNNEPIEKIIKYTKLSKSQIGNLK